MKKTVLFCIVLLIIFRSSFSQSIIRGKVTDDKGEALIAATVAVKNTTIGTVTDFDGNYSLKIPETTGSHTLVVSYIGYQTWEEVIEVKKGAVLIKNYILAISTEKLDEAIVIGRANRASEAYVIQKRLNAVVSMDFISKETIKRTGDSRVDDALKRVTGVSTFQGFITVRGLADRYIKTTINGSRIPTLDPLTNNIKLDMFPTSLVDNIMVTKTNSPNLPGDWAGAYLSIETKAYPEKFQISVKSSFGYNHQSTFKDVVSSQRSSTDWLGYDDGMRDINHILNTEFPYLIEKPLPNQEFKALGLENFVTGLGIDDSHFEDPSGTLGQYDENIYYRLGLVELGLLAPGLIDDLEAVRSATWKYYLNEQIDAYRILNQGTADFGQSLPNSWLTKSRKAPINYSQSFSIGNQVDFLGRPLGFMAGFRYSTLVKNDPNSRKETWSYNSTPGVEAFVQNTDYLRQYTTETNSWSALFTASYKFTNNHGITLLFMPNFTGINKARIDAGFNESGRSNYDWTSVVKHDQVYEQRRQIVYQFGSSHYFPSSKIKVELNASYTDGESSIPDYKSLSYGRKDNDPNLYQFGQVFVPQRRFRYLFEDILDTRVSAEIPFLNKKSGFNRKISFGTFFLSNLRDNEQYNYRVEGLTDNDVTRDVENYFDTENFGLVYNEGDRLSIPYYYDYNFSEIDFSTGYSNVLGGYLMVDYYLFKSLKVSGGLRVEYTDILSDIEKYRKLGYPAGDPRRQYPQGSGAPPGFNGRTADPGVINQINYLPSINLIYRINNSRDATINARLNYNKTLARPSIREIAPFWAWDLELGGFVVGRPDLKLTTIDNYDLRFESYFLNGDNMSLSVFNKVFHDHIELANEGVFTWRNAEEGFAYGVELEGKKEIVKNLDFGANITYVYTRTEVKVFRIDGVYSGGNKTRPMFGQAPYIFNALLSYDWERIGLSSAITYNMQGPKLALTSIDKETPDIYELSRHLFDFTLSQQLWQNFSLEFKIRNILNAPVAKAYDGNGINSAKWSEDSEMTKLKSIFNNDRYIWDKYFYRYKYGTNYVLSISYSL